MVYYNFAKSLGLVLQSEGGNVDDPEDPGGRTSRGITQREYNNWLYKQGMPSSDVWQASQASIDAIYDEEYWQPCCDMLPVGIDYVFFNNSVLDGRIEATLLLQRAAGAEPDGRFGPKTLAAVMKADPAILIESMANLSRKFYLSLHKRKYIIGWLNRVKFVQVNALAMLQPNNVIS